MDRPLTDTEKNMIGRDASEQRSLSAELNGRAALCIALFAITSTLVSQADTFTRFPAFPRILVICGIAGIVMLLFTFTRRRQYQYVLSAQEWIEWCDEQSAMTSMKTEEMEAMISQDYWRLWRKRRKRIGSRIDKSP